MPRWAMVTDLRRCVGCSACTAACSAEWEVPPGHARTRVRQTPLAGKFPELSRSVFVSQCNHCDDPPCVPVCPSGATHQGRDGAVAIDRDLCIGCGYCVDACPYDARFIDPVRKKADKCDFCAPRIARGQAPACVATCTAGAKHFGDLEDPASEVHRLVFTGGAKRIESAEVAVGPNVYYLGTDAQLAAVAAAYPPRRPRMPVAGQAWERLFRPLVLTMVAATFAGQAVAFFNQLRKGEADYED